MLTPLRRAQHGATGSEPHLLHLLLRAALIVLISLVLAAPLATIWGVGRTQITDFLGPNETTIAVDYTGETRIDLGPLGNAYLPMSYGPVGVSITIGGIREAEGGHSLLSEQTLQAYLNLYHDPQEAMAGIRQQLIGNAIRHTIPAEIVIALLMIGWTQRRRFLSGRLVRMSRGRHAVLTYIVVTTVTVAAVVAPTSGRPAPARYPVTIADGTRFSGLTVDSDLLAELLDRGIKGVEQMANRQNQAIKDYTKKTVGKLSKKQDRIAEPAEGEQMLFGFSDLHCNIAMTKFWTRVTKMTDPDAVFSTGDDTMNGTAAEQSCITNEMKIPGDRPFIDSPGNHDSQTTANQLKSAGATVLTGKATDIDGIKYLGDIDPEYNPPFSVDRVQERSETEAEMGKRMIQTAKGRNIDVIMMHQPRATEPVIDEPNPPAKLVAWGHMHSQDGPKVIYHDDGSWTVAIQMGTAGGVSPPLVTSFSTPFSPPRTSADGYLYFRDKATGLITGVQPIHALPNGTVKIDDRINTGDLSKLPKQTRSRLDGHESPPAVGSAHPTDTPEPGTTSEPGKTSGPDNGSEPSTSVAPSPGGPS